MTKDKLNSADFALCHVDHINGVNVVKMTGSTSTGSMTGMNQALAGSITSVSTVSTGFTGSQDSLSGAKAMNGHYDDHAMCDVDKVNGVFVLKTRK